MTPRAKVRAVKAWAITRDGIIALGPWWAKSTAESALSGLPKNGKYEVISVLITQSPLSEEGEVSTNSMERERTLIWCTWMELNAIRSRDGAPRMHDGTKASVSEEYFSRLVDALSDVLGEESKPWPQNYMKPYLP